MIVFVDNENPATLVFAQELLHIFHLGKLRILGERHHGMMIITVEEKEEGR